MLKIDENSGYKGVRKVKKCKWVMIYINTFIENYYIIKYGAYTISADTGESCGRVCRAVDKRRVSGKRQQGQYRCCEIQWWRYSAAYVS